MAPNGPISAYPRSSIKITTTLGVFAVMFDSFSRGHGFAVDVEFEKANVENSSRQARRILSSMKSWFAAMIFDGDWRCKQPPAFSCRQRNANGRPKASCLAEFRAATSLEHFRSSINSTQAASRSNEQPPAN